MTKHDHDYYHDDCWLCQDEKKAEEEYSRHIEDKIDEARDRIIDDISDEVTRIINEGDKPITLNELVKIVQGD